MLSSSLMSSGTKLTRLYSSSSDATDAFNRRKRGPVLADKLHSASYRLPRSRAHIVSVSMSVDISGAACHYAKFGCTPVQTKTKCGSSVRAALSLQPLPARLGCYKPPPPATHHTMHAQG
jgi:hypothetical protein